jgi:hypothetical protein
MWRSAITTVENGFPDSNGNPICRCGFVPDFAGFCRAKFFIFFLALLHRRAHNPKVVGSSSTAASEF